MEPVSTSILRLAQQRDINLHAPPGATLPLRLGLSQIRLQMRNIEGFEGLVAILRPIVGELGEAEHRDAIANAVGCPKGAEPNHGCWHARAVKCGTGYGDRHVI